MAGPKAVAQYGQVREKVEAGLPVVAAIRAVAVETGVSAGTLQTAYYRVAREAGVVKPRKARKSAKMHAVAKPVAASRRVSGGRSRLVAVSEPATAELLRQLVDAAAALGVRVEQLERDSERLRQIEAALAG
jgi:DNA-binding transcriptional regulator YhcF (GntR family)